MGYLTLDTDATAKFCGLREWSEALSEVVITAEAEVDTQCGPVLTERLTQTIRGHVAEVVLPARVSELVSVVSLDGTSVEVSEFCAQGQVVSRCDGAPFGPVLITWDSGWESDEIPPQLVMAGKLLARHMWRTTRGNQGLSDIELPAGSAWLWPRQALALAGPWLLAPGGFA